jgi:hypothetical protein
MLSLHTVLENYQDIMNDQVTLHNIVVPSIILYAYGRKSAKLGKAHPIELYSTDGQYSILHAMTPAASHDNVCTL